MMSREPEWAEAAADVDAIESLRVDLDSGIAKESLDRTLDRGREWGQQRAFDSFQVAACSIASTLDPRALVAETLDAAIRSLGAERGILYLGTGEGGALVPVVARDVAGEELESIERISRTILERGQAGEVQVLQDARLEPTLREAHSIPLKSIRSVLCAPLVTRGRTIGVIYLDAPSTHWTFPDEVGRFLKAFAGLAAALLANAHLYEETRREVLSLRRLAGSNPFDRIIAVSKKMRSTLDEAAVAAGTDMSVLLVGETGTGKNLIAQTIHDASRRGHKHLVYYNCAAIPEALMESIFFGVAKGAFTGAVRATRGLFREADGSSLFLDEISKLDADLQGKLLRAVDDGVARPVGGDQYTVDSRLISASQPDLINRLGDGTFLKELYHRVSVVEISVPPLRERPEDIPPMVDHFLLTDRHAQGRGSGIRFTPDAMDCLQSMPWMGNARELQSLVRRLVLFARRDVVDADLVRRIESTRRDQWAAYAQAERDTVTPPAEPPEPVPTLAECEREAIQRALDEADGNVSRAAQLLGMHRNTLARKVQKLEIQTTS